MSEESPYEKLRTLIYANRKKEKKCRAYLKYAEDILFKRPGINILCDVEYRGHRGDSDFIVTGTGNVSGCDLTLAVIWELKAPQCFLFEIDRSSSNRLKPTKDLVEAENQLLNYYDELKYSQDFRDEFQITHSENVCIGGIIIGCDRTLVKGDLQEIEKDRLYRKARRCRQLLYKCENIELYLWNRILDHLKIPSPPPQIA